MTSRNPDQATLVGLTPDRFGLIRFRSPLLTESQLLSLPGGTEMVHFPPFASAGLYIHPEITGYLVPLGFPIRKSPDRCLFAAPRSLSQLITSFIAFLRQGIHRAPLVT